MSAPRSSSAQQHRTVAVIAAGMMLAALPMADEVSAQGYAGSDRTGTTVASLDGSSGDWQFLERGVASWYGPDFHGRPTASGEIYDQNAMTAAHPWLPFGTEVRVTNLNTGRFVDLRVNDRGPNTRGRAIDISYRAAQKIGLIGHGTTEVDIETLGPVRQPGRQPTASTPKWADTNPADMTPCGPTYQAAAGTSPSRVPRQVPSHATLDTNSGYLPPPATLPDELPGQYAYQQAVYVQVGAFEHAENAAIVDANLRHLAPTSIEPVDYYGRRLHRVRLGPFSSRDEAEGVLSAVDDAGFHGAKVVRD